MFIKSVVGILISTQVAYGGGVTCSQAVGAASGGKQEGKTPAQEAAKGDKVNKESSLEELMEEAQAQQLAEAKKALKFGDKIVKISAQLAKMTQVRMKKHQKAIDKALKEELFRFEDLENALIFDAQLLKGRKSVGSAGLLIIGNAYFVISRGKVVSPEKLNGIVSSVKVDKKYKKIQLHVGATLGELKVVDLTKNSGENARSVDEVNTYITEKAQKIQDHHNSELTKLFSQSKNEKLQLSPTQQQAVLRALIKGEIEYSFLARAEVYGLVKDNIGFVQRERYEVLSNPEVGDLIFNGEHIILVPVEFLTQGQKRPSMPASAFEGFDIGKYSYVGKPGGIEILPDAYFQGRAQ